MPPADAGSGHVFVANEGLTTLATIMPPTFVGSEFRPPSVFALRSTPRQVGSPIADLSMIDVFCQCIIYCEDQQI